MPAPDANATPLVFAVTYRPREEDYFALMHQYLRLTRARRLWTRGLQAFVIGSGVLAAASAWSLRDPVLAGFALVILSAPVTAPAINRWVWRRAFHRQRLGAADVTLEFSDAGLASRSERGQSQIPWATVERVDVLETQAILWLSGSLGLMAPRRAFPDAAAFDRFVDFARSRVPSRTPD